MPYVWSDTERDRRASQSVSERPARQCGARVSARVSERLRHGARVSAVDRARVSAVRAPCARLRASTAARGSPPCAGSCALVTAARGSPLAVPRICQGSTARLNTPRARVDRGRRREPATEHTFPSTERMYVTTAGARHFPGFHAYRDEMRCHDFSPVLTTRCGSGLDFRPVMQLELHLSESPDPRRDHMDDRFNTAVEEQQVEDEVRRIIVGRLKPASRHNVVRRLAHGFGWETKEDGLSEAARELGVDIDVIDGRIR